MATHNRYVFVDFRVLKQIKFKKLEQVCDRVFIFVNKREENIPYRLIDQLKRFGENAEWIAIDCPPETDFRDHINFVMGRMHQSTSREIEFAILSNDSSLDSVVKYINQSDRICIRVKNKQKKKYKQKKSYKDPIDSNASIFEQEEDAPVSPFPQGVKPVKTSDFRSKVSVIKPLTFKHTYSDGASLDLPDPSTLLADSVIDDEYNSTLIDQTAQDTILRLHRSGNRPAEIATLKNYILLHNQELTIHGNIDKIIRKMEETNEIEIHEQEVKYNF